MDRKIKGKGKVFKNSNFKNILKNLKCFFLNKKIPCFSKNHFKYFSKFLKVFFKILLIIYFLP